VCISCEWDIIGVAGGTDRGQNMTPKGVGVAVILWTLYDTTGTNNGKRVLGTKRFCLKKQEHVPQRAGTMARAMKKSSGHWGVVSQLYYPRDNRIFVHVPYR